MSIKSLAKIICTKNLISMSNKMEFAFWLSSISIKYKLGLNVGANVSPEFYDSLGKLKENEIIIELLDSPISVNVELLFLGDGMAYSICDEKMNTSEPLLSRMNRVQNFFEELLDNKNIKSVSVDIDAENTFDYQEFDKMDIKISDFANTMVELFKKEDQWTPTVRIKFK